MFKGPLGIWNFPLLNLLLEMMQGSAGQKLRPAMKNVEVIKWTDWKDRPREIEIHREVESLA